MLWKKREIHRKRILVCMCLTTTGPVDTDHFLPFPASSRGVETLHGLGGVSACCLMDAHTHTHTCTWSKEAPTHSRTQGRCFGHCFHSQISSQDFAELEFPPTSQEARSSYEQKTLTNTHLCLYIPVKTHPAAFPVDLFQP